MTDEELDSSIYLHPQTLAPLLEDYFNRKGKGLWGRAWDMNSATSRHAAELWLEGVILEIFNG